MSDYSRDDITAKRKEVVNRFTQSKFEDLVDSYQRMVSNPSVVFHYFKWLILFIIWLTYSWFSPIKQNVNLQEKMLEVIDRLLPKGPEIDYGIDGPLNVCLQTKILNNMANRGGLYIDF